MIEQINRIAEIWWNWMWPMFWQVSVLIAIIALIDFVIRKHVWPQVRYALWLLVLVKLLLPPSFALPTGVISHMQPLVDRSMQQPATPDRTVPLLTEQSIGSEMAESPVTIETRIRTVNTAQPSFSWHAIAMIGWMVTTFLLMLQLLGRHRTLRRVHCVKDCGRDLPRWLPKLLDDTAEKLHLRQMPHVVLSSTVNCPAVLGLFRPVLLLPATSIERLSQQDVEHILLHELAHIKRRDLPVHAVCVLLQIVYWFNPLLILVRRQLQRLREMCCDATVAGILKDKTEAYSQTILRTVEWLVNGPSYHGIGLLGLIEDPNHLRVRLEWLKKKPSRHPSLRIATSFGLVVTIFAFILPMAKAEKSNEDIKVAAESKVSMSLHQAAKKGDLEQVRSLISRGADVNIRGDKGGTPLHSAAWNGRKAVVGVLLEHGANINALQEGWTPLHSAAYSGNWDLVAFLIDKGAKVEAGIGQEGYGFCKDATPLHIAAHYACADVVKGLLAKGLDIQIKDEEGNTPLHQAAMWAGRSEILELLLEKGADVHAKNKVGRIPLHGAPVLSRRASLEKVNLLIAHGSDVRTRDDEGWTVLHQAAASGHLDVVKVLLDHGADINAETTDGRKPVDEALKLDSFGLNATQLAIADFLLKRGTNVSTIHLAAYTGDLEQVRKLIEKGVNVDAKHASGLAPLHTAASGGHLPVISYLLSRGAKVNEESARDKSLHANTPLHYAAIAGHADAAQMLITHGAKVNGLRDDGWTPLHDAAFHSQRDVARVLLDNGAEINKRGGANNRTPLADAMDRGDKEVVELLISRGADVNAGVLLRAVAYEHTDIVKLLIAEGADVNAQIEDFGWAPLHWAVRSGHREIVEMLLTAGAKINIKDSEGNTPLRMAQNNGHTKVVELLQKHGAKE